MNSTIDNLVTVAVENLLAEIHRLRTLVPDPELLEALADHADVACEDALKHSRRGYPCNKYDADAQTARELAQRIREWPEASQ